MSISVNCCSLACCNYEIEQTKYSRNYRIAAVVLGILFTGAGIGITVGVGSFGWALISFGIISFMVGSCCFYQKEERSHHPSNSPIYVPYRERPANLANHLPIREGGNEPEGYQIEPLNIQEIEEQQIKIINTKLIALYADIFEYMGIKIDSNNLEEAESKLEYFKGQFEIIKDIPDSNHASVKNCLDNVVYAIEILTKQIGEFKQSAEQVLSKTADPQLEIDSDLQKIKDMQIQASKEADTLNQVEVWEKKANALWQKIVDLSKSLPNTATITNLEDYKKLEDCTKQRILLKEEFKELKKEHQTLISIHTSYKSRLESKFDWVSDRFLMLDTAIDRLETYIDSSIKKMLPIQEVENQNNDDPAINEDVESWRIKMENLRKDFLNLEWNARNLVVTSENIQAYEKRFVELEQSLTQLKNDSEGLIQRLKTNYSRQYNIESKIRILNMRLENVQQLIERIKIEPLSTNLIKQE